MLTFCLVENHCPIRCSLVLSSAPSERRMGSWFLRLESSPLSERSKGRKWSRSVAVILLKTALKDKRFNVREISMWISFFNCFCFLTFPDHHCRLCNLHLQKQTSLINTRQLVYPSWTFSGLSSSRMEIKHLWSILNG